MIMVAKKVFAINNYLYTYFICIYVYLYPHFTNRTMSSTWRILVNIWVNINMRTNRIDLQDAGLRLSLHKCKMYLILQNKLKKKYTRH